MDDKNDPVEPRGLAAKLNRRRFLDALTLGLGGLMGLVLSVPAIRFLFFPVGRKVVSDSGEPIDVIGVDQIPAGGPPVRVEISGRNVRDAWGVADDAKIGAAFLQRSEAGEVTAFSCVCPHLGCAVDFDRGSDRFKCPCHKSAFARSGDKLGGPSKRGLDPLPVVIEDGRVVLTWKRYKTDIAERVEV
jgi:menaquinol-cytochrome c reductase iron-sulfur subunit